MAGGAGWARAFCGVQVGRRLSCCGSQVASGFRSRATALVGPVPSKLHSPARCPPCTHACRHPKRQRTAPQAAKRPGHLGQGRPRTRRPMPRTLRRSGAWWWRRGCSRHRTSASSWRSSCSRSACARAHIRTCHTCTRTRTCPQPHTRPRPHARPHTRTRAPPQVILPRLPAAATAAVFSRNFSHALVLNLRQPGNYLHAMAKRVMVRAAACQLSRA